jgi:hypothetical protein
LGPGLTRQRDIGDPGNPAPVAFDVDDHGVELGLGDQLKDAIPDLPLADSVIREVGRLDHVLLQDDVERRRRG